LAALAKLELGVNGGVFKPELICVRIGLRGIEHALFVLMTSTLTVTVGLGVGALDAVPFAIGERDGVFVWARVEAGLPLAFLGCDSNSQDGTITSGI
jgi:hypothetical protein